jgi:hypothetical protein
MIDLPRIRDAGTGPSRSRGSKSAHRLFCSLVAIRPQRGIRATRICYLIVAAAGIASLALAEPAAAQNNPTTSTAPPTAATAATPAMAEQADRLLRQMGAYIAAASEFTFHADILFDHVLPSGQKLQFAAAQEVALKRPDRLYIEYRGDLGDRRFWYDGKSVALFDPAASFYAAEPAPPEIEGMLEGLVKDLDFSPPLADFLYSDPYQVVRANVQYGFDLGEAQVNGMTCRALGFVEKDIDWQIWISDGPQLIPCKLVITYKTLPSQPQFSAVFTEWNFAPRIAEPVFTPEVPPGTQKIPFETAATTSAK